MKTRYVSILITVAALFAGCATLPPKELTDARAAYKHASEGQAGQLAPAEVHKAHEALAAAEQSFQKEPKSYKTKDLAYIAQRKAELAIAIAAMASDKASKEAANTDFQTKQTELLKQGKQDLSASEKRTAETLAVMAADKAAREKSDAELQKKQAELDKQGKQDLNASEKRTADAMAALAKLAAVKEEARGLVVTLSGSVLFRSGDSKLLSSAKAKLDQVAEALLAVRARNLIVEGHTDSQGSESYNQGLSQRRAEAVRDYLVKRGYPADHIQASGKGKGSAIADNASPEGRANNRRVEIVIVRE